MNSYHEKPDLDGVLCYDVYDYYLLQLICNSYLKYDYYLLQLICISYLYIIIVLR